MNDKRKDRQHITIGAQISTAAAAAVAVALAGQGPEIIVSRPAGYEPDFAPLLPREHNYTAPRSPKERFRKSSKR